MMPAAPHWRASLADKKDKQTDSSSYSEAEKTVFK